MIKSEEIKTKVEKEGKIVILDRYCYSGGAYSMSNGLDSEWCKAADSGLPEPDLVIFLDIKAESTGKRADFGNEIYEKIEFQKKVYDNFVKLFEDKNWIRVDADQEFDEVKKEVLMCVDHNYKEFLENQRGFEGLGKVWTGN